MVASTPMATISVDARCAGRVQSVVRIMTDPSGKSCRYMTYHGDRGKNRAEVPIPRFPAFFRVCRPRIGGIHAAFAVLILPPGLRPSKLATWGSIICARSLRCAGPRGFAFRRSSPVAAQEDTVPIYKAPIDEVLFLLNDVFQISRYNNLPGFADASPDVLEPILTEAAKLCEEVVQPLN